MDRGTQDACYAIFHFDDGIKALQEEAMIEVLTLTPGEKQSRLGSYGLTPPCRALSNAVLMGMGRLLEGWAANCGRIITDLHKPFLRPEAFRLQKGCAIWPTQDHTALLMPLSSGRAHIELLPRGSNNVIPMWWDPGMVLHLNEMGLRLKGNGSVRFIYILFRTAPFEEVTFW
ncbi:hypothetical protein NM208_g9758 [Fusarium decemcellulare]|uniref:Uncharacterized protein n=1 Tax=Fusarium decemcellulare TaxID=57161 RepID=A0ACC1S0L7_9HYPO|nr:hypothetical protein NM208_g9758 [Fusarium decemcellulare]